MLLTINDKQRQLHAAQKPNHLRQKLEVMNRPVLAIHQQILLLHLGEDGVQFRLADGQVARARRDALLELADARLPERRRCPKAAQQSYVRVQSCF